MQAKMLLVLEQAISGFVQHTVNAQRPDFTYVGLVDLTPGKLLTRGINTNTLHFSVKDCRVE